MERFEFLGFQNKVEFRAPLCTNIAEFVRHADFKAIFTYLCGCIIV
jgi:hypothetical protein